VVGEDVNIRQANERLRAFALGLPDAYEDHPWDEVVIKVNKKIFVFFGLEADLDRQLALGVKLPQTGVYARQLPFVQPSGYGLGKAGWVSVKLGPGDDLPVDMLEEWIEESYRAIAPKRLTAQLDSRQSSVASRQ
jgi:predicted DNA-binding protein (MmcQ/YjbR family)